MRKYRILSVIIVLAGLLFLLNSVFFIFEKMGEVESAQMSVKNYKERMSSPVNALDPTATSASSSSAKLIIPKLKIDCTIRSDTVNAYDAVYHYPQSAGYGQPGESAILGHRTTYSELFRDIGSLEPGDKVMIQDLVLNRVYTYEVTSNGDDIRWDYKTNPLQFALEGEPRLLLVTCYPPGEKSAAYITHCKLISTSSI